jgi:hypothetical protein
MREPFLAPPRSIYGTAIWKSVKSIGSALVVDVSAYIPTVPPPAGGLPVIVPTCVPFT